MARGVECEACGARFRGTRGDEIVECPECGAEVFGDTGDLAKRARKARSRGSGVGGRFLQGCLGLVVMIGLCIWGIGSCVKRNEQARIAEQQRRAALTEEQRQAEDRIAEAKEAAKRAAEEEEEKRNGAATISEDYVREFLKFPDDADFGWAPAVISKHEDGVRYRADGKVKAKNAFGAQLTYRWATILRWEAGRWRLLECAIDGKVVYRVKE